MSQAMNAEPNKGQLKSSNQITIAVSLHALFNLKDYNPQQEPKQGPAFPFVQALKAVKKELKKKDTSNGPQVNIIIMIPEAEAVNQQLELIIQKFTRDNYCQPVKYDNEMDLIRILKNENTKLYLSMDQTEVINAITQNIAAARLFTPDTVTGLSESQLRVVLDGDGVIFSDEAETVMTREGLRAFQRHEVRKKGIPLPEGPLKGFLEVLVELQNWEEKNREKQPPLIRTFLVTSRDALDSGRRALNTLRGWNLNINEMFFLGGSAKGPILQAIKPHVFFDDHMKHINSAIGAGVIAAHVPYGIAQQHNKE